MTLTRLLLVGLTLLTLAAPAAAQQVERGRSSFTVPATFRDSTGTIFTVASTAVTSTVPLVINNTAASPFSVNQTAGDSYSRWNRAATTQDLLLTWQENGTDKWYAGLRSAATASSWRIYSVDRSGGAGDVFTISTAGAVTLPDVGTFGWSDVSLSRDGAGVLAQRNGTNGQTFRLYSTYTSASNYENLVFRMLGGAAQIYTEKGGSGGAAQALSFGTDGTLRWNFSTSGHFLAVTDNTYDIGASGSEPRSIRAKTSFGGASTTGTLVTNDAQTVANDAVISLGTNTVRGMIIVTDSTTDSVAIFALRGANNLTTEVSDPAGIYSDTAGTASSFNIYWSAGNSRYELENKRGASRNIHIVRLGI